jgi:ABC-type uncharacterized transport system permease subunit
MRFRHISSELFGWIFQRRLLPYVFAASAATAALTTRLIHDVDRMRDQDQRATPYIITILVIVCCGRRATSRFAEGFCYLEKGGA